MKRSEIIRLFPGVDPATISLLPVLDQFHEGIMITDARGILLYMNDTQAMIDDLKAVMPSERRLPTSTGWTKEPAPMTQKCDPVIIGADIFGYWVTPL